jgi:hypothetical protein
LNTHPYIFLPSMPRSSKSSLYLRLSHQNPLSHSCYMPHPSHSSLCDHENNIWWGGQMVNLCIMQSVHSHVTLSLLGPNVFLSILFLNTLSLCPFLMWETAFYTHIKEQARCVVLYVLIFTFLDIKLKGKRFCTKW